MSKIMTLQDLKSNLDILQIAQGYCELKRVNNNDYVAINNPIRDEKTSSLHFYVDTQKFYDFGSSEGGDVFDLVSKCENISLSDAVNRFKNDSFHMPSTPKPIKEKTQLPHAEVIEISSEQLQKEFDSFERIDIKNTKHYTELLNVIPYWLYETANKEDLALFTTITRYDSKNDTLVSGWYENSLIDFKMITYKRRRLYGDKWRNRKSTHPNQVSFSRIYDEAKPIFIIEGMRDALTAVLLGLNFIAIPTTSFNNFDDINQAIKPTDEVIFICEDMQGYASMSYLSGFIPKSRLLTFIRNKDEKIDLSDFVMSRCSVLEVFNAVA